MAVVITTDLRDTVLVGDRIAAALRLADREAVNKSALVVTQAARRAVQAAIGPEQRLSGVKISATWTVVEGQRVHGQGNTAGIKINPAYKPADSTTKPVAIIGVRGPAHYIEHRRRGGYEIRVSGRRTLSRGAPSVEPLDVSEILGRTTARVRSGAAARRPALKVGDGFRYTVKGGAITSPLAPITKTFQRAPAIIAAAAEEAIEQGLRRRLGSVR